MAGHYLNDLELPRGMVWIDEMDFVPVEKETERSITGNLIVDAAARVAGRPITLVGTENAGWIRRATLLALHALAANPAGRYTLTLADSRVFTVEFAAGEPITAKPAHGRPELPPSTYPYAATVRLITVDESTA